MPVTAVFVAYNSAGVIGAALERLRAAGVERCIVVDNASRDETRAAVRTVWPEAELIESPENLGFGRGNNLALERVNTEFALLINPDARLDAPALHALLAAAARYPEAAILAPQLADSAGHVLHTHKRSVFARERAGGAWLPPEGDLCAECLSGAVWLVRMSAMRALGGFDPDIFLYYEDDDLCLRARTAGFSCVLVAGAAAEHWVGKSSGGAGERLRHRYMAQSRLYIERKYHGEHAAHWLAIRMALHAGAKWLWYAGRTRRARYAGRIEGVIRRMKP